MSERLDLYRCSKCGNLVEVILGGVGELMCCGAPMEKLIAKVDKDTEFSERHIPVFTVSEVNGEEVRVGSTLHPMSDEHYIQFVETISKDKDETSLKYYSPLDLPIKILREKFGPTRARAFCNIHGLWEGNK